MTNSTHTVEETVSQEQAIRFLEHAFRNIDLPPLSSDDVADIVDGLRYFVRSLASHSTPAGEDEAIFTIHVKPEWTSIHTQAGKRIKPDMALCAAIKALSAERSDAAKCPAHALHCPPGKDAEVDVQLGVAAILEVARILRETANGDGGAIEQALVWERRAAALSSLPPSTHDELVEALEAAGIGVSLAVPRDDAGAIVWPDVDEERLFDALDRLDAALDGREAVSALRLTKRKLHAIVDALMAALAGTEGEGDMAETSFKDLEDALEWAQAKLAAMEGPR